LHIIASDISRDSLRSSSRALFLSNTLDGA
jgi:hypothetical protein